MNVKLQSSFNVIMTTDEFVLITDNDQGMSVTNDAHNVVRWLDTQTDGPLGNRQIYYRDTTGRFDEISHVKGDFSGFKPCPQHVSEALALLVEKNESGA